MVELELAHEPRIRAPGPPGRLDRTVAEKALPNPRAERQAIILGEVLEDVLGDVQEMDDLVELRQVNLELCGLSDLLKDIGAARLEGVPEFVVTEVSHATS
ncbi:hypothetical protein [Streptomyces sp. NPDC048581]|uniref:hypothetical protein n=1 Tax=unclassified Streptomyces TaxID=2593676 RepID=UPI00371D1CC6